MTHLISHHMEILDDCRVTNDLLWCLYGFIKNLPETGEMIHGFVEYSLGTDRDLLNIEFYHSYYFSPLLG